MAHHHHGSNATSNAWIAGMVTLASVAVYWYMSTTEEQRAEQREQVKDKASNAAKQVAGNCSDNMYLEQRLFVATVKC